MKQLELFKDLGNQEKEGNFKAEEHETSRLWRFKRYLFLVIYSIIILTIGFALGIKHARQIPEVVPKESVKLTVKPAKPVKSAPLRAVSKPKEKPAAKVKGKYKYVIQAASFKKLSSARSERNSLKKGGFKAYLEKSAKYIKVYIGPFKTKPAAAKRLKAVRKKYPKQYRDAFVRKVK